MAPWPSTFMVGTNTTSDFKTLNELFGVSYAINPDCVFLDFSEYRDKLDGGEIGVGFPAASLKYSGNEDLNIEALRGKIPNQSAAIYWRLPTNRASTMTGEIIWRTFLTQTLWVHGEDKQAGHTLGFELRLRRLIVQVEAT